MNDKKYESDRTPKEKKQKELEIFRSLSGKKRVEHFLRYYKTQTFVCVLLIAAIAFAGFVVYRLRFDTVLNVLILNNGTGNTAAMGADWRAYAGDQDRFHDLLIDDTMVWGGSKVSDRYKEMKLSAYIQNKVVDVMVLDRELFEAYAESGILEPVFKLFTPEEEEMLGLETENVYGIRMPMDSVFWDYGYIRNEDTYMVVLANAPYPENAKKYIRFMLE